MNVVPMLQGPTSPPETPPDPPAVLKRARDIAGDAFDCLDSEAVDWIHDNWGEEDMTLLVMAAIVGADVVLAKERLRDRYIDERERNYRDLARKEFGPPEGDDEA
jgi:hypothetical protein